MKTVQQVLQDKAPGVITIAPDATVFDALERMAREDIGALVVVDGGRVVGIISERDYARKVVLHNKFSKDVPVTDIMTDRVLYVRPDQTVDTCMALMTDRRIRHLPVLDGEELVGVLSIGDLVRATIDDQRFTIKQLETYIAG